MRITAPMIFSFRLREPGPGRRPEDSAGRVCGNLDGVPEVVRVHVLSPPSASRRMSTLRRGPRHSGYNMKLIIKLIVIAGLGFGVAACGSSTTTTTPASTPAAGTPAAAAATQPASATPSSSSAIADTEPADATACQNLLQAYNAFTANENTTTSDALTAASIPNASMTQTLFNEFQALNGDLDDTTLTGSPDATAQADEQAVATGCAAAGVQFPASFTGS